MSKSKPTDAENAVYAERLNTVVQGQAKQVPYPNHARTCRCGCILTNLLLAAGSLKLRGNSVGLQLFGSILVRSVNQT